jgi:hypothetical protein
MARFPGLAIGLLWGALFVASCSSVPKVSPAQRHDMQVRTFEGAKLDGVFRAFKTVLQDESAIIRSQDVVSGIIVASLQKTTKEGAFWLMLGWEAEKYHVGDDYELTVNLTQGENGVESRLSIEKLKHYMLGGQGGEEILSTNLYARFYERVQNEVSGKGEAKKNKP